SQRGKKILPSLDSGDLTRHLMNSERCLNEVGMKIRVFQEKDVQRVHQDTPLFTVATLPTFTLTSEAEKAYVSRTQAKSGGTHVRNSLFYYSWYRNRHTESTGKTECTQQYYS